MGNTVMDESTSEACVEEIRLLLNSDVNGGKVIVQVEGDDDVRAYRALFDGAQVEFSVAGTCALIPETMMLVGADEMLKDKVIGIKDADFDHLMGITYPSSNLFLTDTHDAETMMLTERVMARVCCETMKRNEPMLLEDVVKALRYYSYIRYYNAKEILPFPEKDGLLFDGLKVNVIYDGIHAPSLHDWHQKVKMHGNNAVKSSFPTEEQLDSFVQTHSTDDWQNLTCGHDLIHCVMKKIHTICPEAVRYGEAMIASLVRMAYTFDDFRQTELYASMDTWAMGRGLSLWSA